jgi:hypothetical protein
MRLTLTDAMFWRMKWKIGILTLATFIALC